MLITPLVFDKRSITYRILLCHRAPLCYITNISMSHSVALFITMNTVIEFD